MKMILIAPRAAVDLLVGRCTHHAVLIDSGDWVVVADIHDAELAAQVLVQEGVLELPHSNSSASVPAAAVAKLNSAGVNASDRSRDVLEKVVARHGMPVLLEFLGR